MNRWIKRISIVILTPIILLLIVSVLLYIPSFQNFAKGKAMKYASDITGMYISVDKIHLSFPLNLTVQKVKVISPPRDTLLLLDQLSVSIKMLPLLKKDIQINAVDLQEVTVNSGTLIENMNIKGKLGKLKADHIDLAHEAVLVNRISLSDSHIYICLNDTTEVASDTTSVPVNWKILLQSLALNNVSLNLEIPNDSIQLQSFINQAEIKNGIADLLEQQYGLEGLSISNSSISYIKGDSLTNISGFNPSHLALNNLNIAIDSLMNRGMEVTAFINTLSFQERSGLNVTSLKGKIHMDSLILNIPDLKLTTPYSEISFATKASLTAFDKKPSGQMGAMLYASIGKEDVFTLVSNLPDAFYKDYPNKPFTLQATVDGNMANLHLRSLDTELPGAFQLNAKGSASALTDSIHRSGEIILEGKTENMGFMLAWIDSARRDQFAIPQNIKVKGEASLINGLYRTLFNVTEKEGSIRLSAHYDSRKLNYAANIAADSVQLQHFLPKDSLQYLTASVKANGQGTDFFSAATSAFVEGNISTLQYGNLPISGISLEGSLKNQKATLRLNSTFAPAALHISLDGDIHHTQTQATLTVDAGNIDLHTLHLMNEPFATSFLFSMGVKSDWKKFTKLEGKLSQLKIITPKQTISPKEVIFEASTNTDTTTLDVSAGDLLIKLAGNNNVEELSQRFTLLSVMLSNQLIKENLNLQELRPLLPHLQIQVSAGKDNPIYNYLSLSDIRFNSLNLKANTSPEEGIKVDASIYSLGIDTLQLDSVYLALQQDTTGIKIKGGVINNAENKQHVFSTGVEGVVNNQSAEALFRFTDGQGTTGLLLGLRAQKEKNGFAIHFFPDNPIVAFRTFNLNTDNFIQIDKNKNITADFRMEASDGTALLLTSDPDTSHIQKLNLDIRKIDLALISNLAPYMPEIGGFMNAEVQYASHDSSYHVTASLGIDSLSYEKKGLGNLLLKASYLPGNDKAHLLKASLLHDEQEVLAARGKYYKIGEHDSLLSKITLADLPLWMANAFIPDDMASVAGALKGEINVDGHLSSPNINGYLVMDTASVFINAAATRFRFDDKRVEVHNNRILFNQFGIYTTGTNPFIIDGWMDAANPASLLADLKLSASNMELLNVKRNKQSLVYGKVYVDLQSTVRGPLNALIMRGNIKLLGNTDLTYVLKDSPLTVQDRLTGLVTFVNFADTALIKKEETRPLQLGGLDMLMTINIDQAVRLKADLSDDRESRVELEGGGDLSFQYTPQGSMFLTGRYTLSGGLIKYVLPVVPSKTFNIQNGSYVQWTGNVMDPTLNITATERNRTSVTLSGQSPQMVNFDVSISVKNQLENLSLLFDLSAPENLAVQNQLNAMSTEERNKQAVSMLVTNMYMGTSSGGKVNLDMGNALSSFLQNEINNLAGSALKGVDVSFGMESQNGQAGFKSTDYSFRFSKRFYNDRIRVVIGGKISTGAPEEESQSFIDNISLEYRLDGSGTRYVRLFHNKNYESILEGEITETGVGIVLRKKMRKMRELFIFRKKQKQTTQSTQQ